MTTRRSKITVRPKVGVPALAPEDIKDEQREIKTTLPYDSLHEAKDNKVLSGITRNLSPSMLLSENCDFIKDNQQISNNKVQSQASTICQNNYLESVVEYHLSDLAQSFIKNNSSLPAHPFSPKKQTSKCDENCGSSGGVSLLESSELALERNVNSDLLFEPKVEISVKGFQVGESWEKGVVSNIGIPSSCILPDEERVSLDGNAPSTMHSIDDSHLRKHNRKLSSPAMPSSHSCNNEVSNASYSSPTHGHIPSCLDNEEEEDDSIRDFDNALSEARTPASASTQNEDNPKEMDSSSPSLSLKVPRKVETYKGQTAELRARAARSPPYEIFN